MQISGLHTAVITPFHANGDVDVDAMRRILDIQLAGGVDGVVVTGSTGEAATLSLAEREQLWRIAVEHCAGRITVTAGVGTNDTRSTIENAKAAQAAGIDALLIVSPYYNKPTQAGLLAHFRAVHDAVTIPQILYNVPGRTGQNLSAQTQLAIAEACPNIIATKEASANLEQMSEIIAHASEHFTLLAGDDVLALPTIACGGRGVIAVISNYFPRTYGALIRAALQDDVPTARELQDALLPYFAANFIETNPLPVKYIMHKLGHCANVLRLPLVPVTAASAAALDEIVATIDDSRLVQ
jgi:4-hydroxy-tetrahydrodipicolinate synthase